MHEVEVKALPLEMLASVLTPERARRSGESATRARAAFGDRTIWHVNATAHGGGVAEMLQTLLAYGRGAGIENRWLVLDGEPEFFTITKRLHNLLHGDPGDGGDLGAGERACYERVVGTNVTALRRLVDSRDFVLLHDPQTAGMVDGLRANGVRVVWRCHVGCDTRNAETDRAWAFLRPYIEHADAFVFSRQEYVPAWVDQEQVVIIPPSIDPFSAKNRALDASTVEAILATVGLVTGADPDGPVEFERRDGTPGTVRHHTGLIADGAPPPVDARLIVQVSRWDRLKDMAGVLTGFVTMAADGPPDAHLMLVGPDVSGVTDDPEGSQVLADCRALWRSVPASIRDRVHLASIPMDDVDENAIIVNAVQRQAYLVVQKSLVEGFGLTVSEAMWKMKPVIASGVGGIIDQIVDERDGLLINDPADLDALAAAMTRLLNDHELAGRLGAAGHARVVDQFLGDRHLAQYVELFARLASMPTGPRPQPRVRVPRDPVDDSTAAAAQVRRDFLRDATGVAMDDVGRFTLDPATLPGNVENFIGAAQVPIGVAGPLRINGEHARGDFYIPLATTEGTLVASYNRGMRLLTECGGVTTAVVDERMQRAPVFILDDALRARAFGEWIDERFTEITAVAESTTRSGKLIAIEQYAVGPLRYLRFDYTTGDAAGQNLTGKATLAACEWIQANHPGRPRFILSGSIDTDKKHSQINMLRTRGRRVVAEAVIDKTVIEDLMGVDTKTLMWGRQISQAGNFMAASANNGAQAANALAALFIATGQDVANIAESHAGIVYTQLLDNGDYYWSITLPGLIVATYGGGTGLATQRECLDLLGCYGTGKVRKFAEICAAVVLAGDISLSSAVLHGDWVPSHDRLGRNRP
jgi:NADP-dependent 3-hydroxy-3-methylglutaryl-CoA reductase